MMRRLRGRGADEGFTLIELLVAMLITGIVLAMAGGFFVQITKLTTWSNNDRQATGQAALALNAIRAVIRVAADNPASATVTNPAVVAAKATDLSLTAYSNTSTTSTAPTLVRFYLDPTTHYLHMQRTVGTLNVSGYWVFTSAASDLTIAGPFAATPTYSFFRYYDNKGAVMVPGTTGLTLAQRQVVTFVNVTTTLDATQKDADGNPVVVTSSIGMPNVVRDVASTVALPSMPTPTTTPSRTPTPTPTVTPTPSATATPSSTPSASASSSPSPTGSGTGSGGTGTGTGTATPRPTGSGGSGTPAPTGGSGGSGSATPTPTPTRTATRTPTPTPTPTRTATPTPTPTPTKTRTIG